MKKRFVSLIMVLLLLAAIMPTAAFAEENPFTDVPRLVNGQQNPFYEAILWAVDNKITTGYEDNTFRPSNTCTRGHVVTFLWRADGSPEPQSLENKFTDVDPASPFFKAILWAAEKGITTGYEDGTFRPNAACTRAHVVTFLWRYDSKPAAVGAVTLTDLAGLNADFTSAIRWASTNGITTGYSDGTFRPHAVCTRAHVVTFIYRDTMNKVHEHSYTAAVTDPTCTEQGYTTYTCSCGDSYTGNETPALGHKTALTGAKDSTCTEKGYSGDLVCSVCGAVTEKGKDIDALGHKWDNGTVAAEASESEEGSIVYRCTVCGATKTESIPILEHTHIYSDYEKAPTCTEQGCTVHTCTICGDVYSDDYVPALGHTWNSGTVTLDPNKVDPGEMLYTCTVCGATKTESIPPIDTVLCLVGEKTSGNGEVLMTWTYENDKYGNVVSGILTDGTGAQLGSMTVSYFDPAIGSMRETVRIVDGQTETTEYDESNGQIKTQTVTDAAGKVLSLTENTYNTHGFITKSVIKDYVSGIKETNQYTYNNVGQISKEVVTADHGQGIIETTATDYIYKNGILVGQSIAGYSLDYGEFTGETTCTYDAYGRESRRTTALTMENGSTSTLYFTYSYDSAGNLIKEIQEADLSTVFIFTYGYEKFTDSRFGTIYLLTSTSTISPSPEDPSVTTDTTVEYIYAYI